MTDLTQVGATEATQAAPAEVGQIPQPRRAPAGRTHRVVFGLLAVGLVASIAAPAIALAMAGSERAELEQAMAAAISTGNTDVEVAGSSVAELADTAARLEDQVTALERQDEEVTKLLETDQENLAVARAERAELNSLFPISINELVSSPPMTGPLRLDMVETECRYSSGCTDEPLETVSSGSLARSGEKLVLSLDGYCIIDLTLRRSDQGTFTGSGTGDCGSSCEGVDVSDKATIELQPTAVIRTEAGKLVISKYTGSMSWVIVDGACSGNGGQTFRLTASRP